jgi:hypothetical protein
MRRSHASLDRRAAAPGAERSRHCRGCSRRDAITWVYRGDLAAVGTTPATASTTTACLLGPLRAGRQPRSGCRLATHRSVSLDEADPRSRHPGAMRRTLGINGMRGMPWVSVIVWFRRSETTPKGSYTASAFRVTGPVGKGSASVQSPLPARASVPLGRGSAMRTDRSRSGAVPASSGLALVIAREIEVLATRQDGFLASMPRRSTRSRSTSPGSSDPCLRRSGSSMLATSPTSSGWPGIGSTPLPSGSEPCASGPVRALVCASTSSRRAELWPMPAMTPHDDPRLRHDAREGDRDAGRCPATSRRSRAERAGEQRPCHPCLLAG